MEPISSLGFVAGQNLDDKLFDPVEIAAAEQVLSQYMVDHFPTLNVGKNASLYDLLIRPRAVAYLISRAEWTALRATQSLKGVLDNPELANDAIVDAILSNDLLKRRIGLPATGKVRVDVSKASNYTIPATMQFVSGDGLQFTPQENYRATTAPSDENDLKLYATDTQGLQFYFIVPVVAVQNGVRFQLSDSIPLVPTPTIPNLIVATSFGNFYGAADDESNQDLIARIPEAKSVKNQVSPLAIRAAIQEQFPEAIDIAVQGMNGRAMTRNSHNILGMKVGGYADIYVRTATTISVGSVLKTASLVSIDGATNIATYKVVLTRDDFPGHYYVRGITSAADDIVGSYLVLSEDKEFDNRMDPNGGVLGTERPNSITTTQEGIYSAFQTNTVYFQVEYDPTLGTVPADQFLASLGVTVNVTYIPKIREIQDFLSDRERGVVMADYLVRAVIPCFVQVSTLTVEADSGTNPADIRLAVFRYINGLKAGDRVRVDEIVSRIKSVPGVRYVQLPIRLTGEIYAPNNTVLVITGDNWLQIPERPEVQVIPETVGFFIELPDIPVALIES